MVLLATVQVGDWVLTYDEQTGEQAYKPVLVKHERYTHQMMALELPTGEFLEVTPEHRFYHNGEWIEARSLKAGDLLHLKNGDYTTIISIENFPKYQKVYNFDIADNENYYVAEDGILVHNGYGLRDKPKYAPDPKKWEKKGGKVEVLEDGTWRYTDWEGNVVDYVNGYPVFKIPDHARQNVDIGKQKGDYKDDYLKAEQLSDKNPPKLNTTTWHHHEDGKTMQEVNSDIHDRFTHQGGVSKAKLAKKKK